MRADGGGGLRGAFADSEFDGAYPLCRDAGSTLPSGSQVLGRVLQAPGGGTTAQMFFDMPGSTAGASAVSSVFGRTGVVTATSGDYAVAQVTGAAPLASPTFTGTVTAPDGTTNTSSGYTFAHALTLPSGSVATTQTAVITARRWRRAAYVRGEQYLTCGFVSEWRRWERRSSFSIWVDASGGDAR